MQKTISCSDHLTTGAFVINDSCAPHFKFEGIPHLFLTQEGNDSLKNEILSIIKSATQVLKICSFIITDREIFDLILERVKSNDVAVFILTQLDSKKITDSTFVTEEEAREQMGSQHLAFIKTLYDHGAHVRASTSAHAKFIVSDRRIGFVMSANMTTPSLTFNTESAVYLEEADTKYLDLLFDVIFQKGTAYRKYISAVKKGKQFILQSESTLNPKWLPKPEDTQLRYSYEDHARNLYDCIVKMVDQADKFIFLSTYSIVGLENLLEFRVAVINAISRGVVISVFCRGMNYRTDHLKGTRLLAEMGCMIYGDVFNHSKGVLTDKSGLIFTANIDGHHGLLNGFEVGYIIDNEKRLAFLEFHKHLIETSPYVFKLEPSRSELFLTYERYERLKGMQPPSFELELKIDVKTGVNISNEELEGMPIFYGQTKGKIKEEFLVVGNSCYKCRHHQGVFQIFERTPSRFDIEKYILKFKNLTINYN